MQFSKFSQQRGVSVAWSVQDNSGCLDQTAAAKQVKTVQENKPLEARSDSPTGS